MWSVTIYSSLDACYLVFAALFGRHDVRNKNWLCELLFIWSHEFSLCTIVPHTEPPLRLTSVHEYSLTARLVVTGTTCYSCELVDAPFITVARWIGPVCRHLVNMFLCSPAPAWTASDLIWMFVYAPQPEIKFTSGEHIYLTINRL